VTHSLTHSLTHVPTHKYMYPHTHIYIYIHAHTCTHTHTYIYIYTHIHMYTTTTTTIIIATNLIQTTLSSSQQGQASTILARGQSCDSRSHCVHPVCPIRTVPTHNGSKVNTGKHTTHTVEAHMPSQQAMHARNTSTFIPLTAAFRPLGSGALVRQIWLSEQKM
jgi:hypothetical protein